MYYLILKFLRPLKGKAIIFRYTNTMLMTYKHFFKINSTGFDIFLLYYCTRSSSHQDVKLFYTSKNFLIQGRIHIFLGYTLTVCIRENQKTIIIIKLLPIRELNRTLMSIVVPVNTTLRRMPSW